MVVEECVWGPQADLPPSRHSLEFLKLTWPLVQPTELETLLVPAGCASCWRGRPLCVYRLLFRQFLLVSITLFPLFAFSYLEMILSCRVCVLIFLLHRSSFSGFSLPFPPKSSTHLSFSPRWVGQDCLLFLWTCIPLPPQRGTWPQKKKPCLSRMSISIENNDEIVSWEKWSWIMCLESLTHPRGFLGREFTADGT